MQKRNYHHEMLQILAQATPGEALLLHACCGPCSSAVLERLGRVFAVTLLYANPNIWPPEEYARRRDEQLSLLARLPLVYPVRFVEEEYDHEAFLAAVQGLEAESEGGARCEQCFRLRLASAARHAQELGIRRFTTTLSVSPHKNAALLSALGEETAAAQGLVYLPSDFKKENGYLRSQQLSEEYGLYRQDYCGCEFSARTK